MATKKQKRRRSKDRRHEWEYVYVDDEGKEVEVDEEEAAPPSPAKRAAGTGSRTAAKPKPGAKSGRPARPVRKIDPPSWRRVLRRGAMFAPVMAVVVYLLRQKDATTASMAIQVVVLLLFFLPFSYMMDSIMYRSYRKRIGDPIPPRERPNRKR
jgi:hypothetical protein